MSATVTLEHAKKIIRKLKAVESARKSKHHKNYDVFYGGKILMSFSVSHTPKKGKPQSHLPDDFKLTAHETRELANCNLSFDEWVKKYTAS